MLFINNNGSTHLSNCIQKTFGFFPSKTWIGNRFSVNMITSDLLISRFNITLDHKPFYQSMKFRVYLAAVENLFCNTNLLVILFIRIRVVGINDNSRIFKVFLLIFFPEKTKILVMIVRDCLPMFIYGTAENCMSQFITCCFYFPASVDKTELSMTARSPLVGFFIPAGTSMPLTVRRCCWSSTERAPTAT